MARKPTSAQPEIEARQWSSTEEIDRAVAKLERRITELEAVDIPAAVLHHTGQIKVVKSNIREAIRDIFGQNSPEFKQHEYLDIWAGPSYMGMAPGSIINGTETGRRQVNGILNGLIGRLKEKREELVANVAPTPKSYLDYLNLHPRIAEVAGDRFRDGYPWDAVFAASKALINYVKDKSGRHDLDGAPLMRTVFSAKNPVLKFNDLSDQTDLDEQEGMMHLFEGVVLGIRNPGGHSFPEGPEQRAVEYLSLISLLAYRVQEAKR